MAEAEGSRWIPFRATVRKRSLTPQCNAYRLVPVSGSERCVLQLITVVPIVVTVSIVTRSVLQSRARRQRSARRRQRHRREAGTWWAAMWLSRDRRQKKLTHKPD